MGIETHHRPPLARRRRALCLGMCVLLGAGATSAQVGPSESELAAARTLGVEGVKLESAGQCEEAVRLLERAAELFAAPTILLPLARCKIKASKFVEGVKVLRQVLDQDLPPDASRQFVDAQAEAEALLSSTLPRLARVSVKVELLGDVQPKVSINGVDIPAEELAAVALNPGKHSISARAPGYIPGKKQVTLKEGERANVSLILEPEPEASAGPALPPDTGAPPPIAAGTPPPDHTLAYISLGVGGAGVIAGAVLGFIAAGKESELQDQCPGGQCPRRFEADLDNTKTLALGSTIGFGVGLVGLGVGSYLLFFDQPSAATGARSGRKQAGHQRGSGSPRTEQLRLGVFARGNKLGIVGAF